MRRTRRDMVRLAGLGLATGALAAAHPAGATRMGLPATDELTGLFAEPGAARAIGQAYLQGHAGPRPDLASLRAEIAHALRPQNTGPAGKADLRARFRGRIRQDFAEARTVLVDGWMLSQVEAQACAIAWLSATGDR